MSDDLMRIMSEPVKANYIMILGWRVDGVICGLDGQPERIVMWKDGETREFRMVNK